MKNWIVLLGIFIFLSGSMCWGAPTGRNVFLGFIVQEFNPIDTYLEKNKNVDLDNERDAELLETVFGRICGRENCQVFTNGNGRKIDVPTYSFVKRKLQERAKNSSDIEMMTIVISTHAFIDNRGELNFVLHDSRLAFDQNCRPILTRNTLSASELSECILEFKCKKLVLILDCCYSGREGILVNLESKLDAELRGPETVVLLTSSSGCQKSQINKKRHNSLYLGYILAGLSGIADADYNGRVTVEELHHYASAPVRCVSVKQLQEWYSMCLRPQKIEPQKPELKKLVKGIDGNVDYAVPTLPFDMSIDFLAQNINDILLLRGIDPRQVNVEDFVARNVSDVTEDERLLGRIFANRIKADINPEVTFNKDIVPMAEGALDYTYSVRGEYCIVGHGLHKTYQITCQLFDLGNEKPITLCRMYASPQANKMLATRAVSEQVSILVGPETANSLAETRLLKWSSQVQNYVPAPRHPDGGRHDYRVNVGDQIAFEVINRSDRPLAVMSFVDGLNIVSRDGEKDAARADSMASHIRKVNYLIIPPDTRRIFKGLVVIEKRDGTTSKYNVRAFRVVDAPASLRSSLNINSSSVDDSLGDIRICLFELSGSGGERGLVGITGAEKSESFVVKKTEYRIRSAEEKPVEVHVMHYAL